MSEIQEHPEKSGQLLTHEIRSPELQEVMSEIPGSFLKWGLFLFFGIIIAILGVKWFISSPDIVTAPLTITTYNPPASLITKSGGKIERFFVSNEDEVREHQPVALIRNQAHWDDIIHIGDFIDTLGNSVRWKVSVTYYTPTQD